jgi:glycerol-3-phosphate dehydrogenase subunit C
MREGGLDAPIRHPIDWENQDYYNEEALDTEMRRVFDICHSCRRCFNLCDSFPQLFDLIDNSPSGELDSVDSKGFQKVNDACTLCDMCFMVSCPYVPPHEFNIDFPKLVLRSRAIDYQKGKVGPIKRLLAKTDFHGKWGSTFSKLSNWATSSHNKFTRQILEWVAGIHKEATLPKYASQTLVNATQNQIPLNKEAPGFGEKVVIYATCFGNFNAPEIGLALRAVLALNGVETLISYPKCCGMPLLEEGNLKQVAENAKIVSNELLPFVAKGYKVLALVPSCALMLKHEWPLLLPNDNHIKKLANATYDLSEYIVELAKEKGLVPGLKPIEGGISIHLPCHARAQNIGHKAVEMLRLIPDTQIHVVERCSGHGGSWGVMKENFPTAIKQGKPVVKQIMKQKTIFCCL